MPSAVGLSLAIVAAGALREVMPESLFRVELSPEEPLELAETAGAQMLVCVFLGDEIHKVTRRRIFEGARTVELVVQVILPPSVALSTGGVQLSPKTRGAGAMLAFATAHRLIETAFAIGPAGSWRELLQALVSDFPEELHGMPGLADRPLTKLKIPLEDYSIPCGVVNSPAIGSALPYPFPEIVAKMRAEPKFAASADFVEALLAGTPLEPWQAEQVRAGLSAAEGNAFGLGVVAPLDDTPPVLSLTATGSLGSETFTPEPAP